MDNNCEQRIGELELEIEEMERTDSLLYGIAFGLLSQLIWHEWVVSFLIAVTVSAVYWKWFAKKPFTKKSPQPD